jgi:hypothetical protein
MSSAYWCITAQAVNGKALQSVTARTKSLINVREISFAHLITMYLFCIRLQSKQVLLITRSRYRTAANGKTRAVLIRLKSGILFTATRRKFDLHCRSNAYAAGPHSLCKSYPQVCLAVAGGYDRPCIGLGRSSLRAGPRHLS